MILQLVMRRAQPAESREIRAWIMSRHYTGSAPPGYVLALEFLEGRMRVGAMLIGRPTSRELDPDVWLELTRMYFLEAAPRFSESRALAMMRRYVRVYLPSVRALIAYSDPSVGHAGTVYAADGWAAFGRTSNHGSVAWRNRPGRRPSPGGRKLRWVRTP